MLQRTLCLSLLILAVNFITTINASGGGPIGEPCQICLYLFPPRSGSDNLLCFAPQHNQEIRESAPFIHYQGFSYSSFNAVTSPWCVCDFTAFSKPEYKGNTARFTLTEICTDAPMPFCAKSFTVTCQRGIPPPPPPEGGCPGSSE